MLIKILSGFLDCFRRDSTDLYKKLKEENIPAELHIFSEEDHAFDSARGYGRSVAELQHLFFKKYL